MERFDLRADGTYRGFEDFCVLNGRRTDQKYSGSYETRVLCRFQQFANSPTVAEESLQLFRLIVFNCAIRNGDAHLKNLLVHHQVIVPVTEGRLDLGPWQQVFYCEFDGRRAKRTIIKVLGA